MHHLLASGSLPNLLLIVLAAFVAALVSGIAGFAFAAVAAALMLPLASADIIVPLILMGSIMTQTLSLLSVQRGINWQRLWPFLAAGVTGVPIGATLLRFTDPHAFRITIGLVLVAFSLHGLVRRQPQPVTFGGRAADAMAGLIGGTMGGYAGLSGIVPTIWCGARAWSRQEQRGVYQPFILIVQAFALAYGGAAGLFSSTSLVLVLLCSPAFLAGTLSGLWVFGKLDERRFRTVVLLLLLGSGAALLL